MRKNQLRPYLCVTFLVIWLLGTTPAIAQDQTWLRQNKRGNRYEGIVDRPNGLADYKVLDLLASTDVDFKDANHLHIAYFLPRGASMGPFQVRERVDETQYLMIPILPVSRPDEWNVFGNWDVRDVIEPNHVRLANLAILIRLNDLRIPEFLVPAVLYGDRSPSVLKHYDLHIFIERALSTLSCTIRDTGGNLIPNTATTGCTISPRPSPGTPSSATERFTIAAAGLTEGMITVHLEGRYANDETSARFNHDIHFYNQPQLSGSGH